MLASSVRKITRVHTLDGTELAEVRRSYPTALPGEGRAEQDARHLVALLFVAANLSVGIMLSSLAQNQLQGVQLTFFYFLPNILLSGFMFPFAGMPRWAQTIGNALPLTYFNRLVRGILLKGAGWDDLWPHVWPMLVFMFVVMALAVRFYRRTLD